jgi:hypothetical protein
MPDRSRCPNCRERVSPFAAGCAICGADLDVRRWDSGPDRLTRTGSWFSALGHGRPFGISPWLLLLIIFFGGTIVSAVVAALSGLFS